jgi:hypothetical protein
LKKVPHQTKAIEVSLLEFDFIFSKPKLLQITT